MDYYSNLILLMFALPCHLIQGKALPLKMSAIYYASRVKKYSLTRPFNNKNCVKSVSVGRQNLPIQHLLEWTKLPRELLKSWDWKLNSFSSLALIKVYFEFVHKIWDIKLFSVAFSIQCYACVADHPINPKV